MNLMIPLGAAFTDLHSQKVVHFLCVQDFCPCTALVNFLETSCYSWKPPGNGLNFTSLETVLHTKSFLGNCLVHCTFPNSVQLGNLVLFGCACFRHLHDFHKRTSMTFMHDGTFNVAVSLPTTCGCGHADKTTIFVSI